MGEQCSNACCVQFPLANELEFHLYHGPCKLAKSLVTPSTWISSTTIVLKGETPKSGKVEVFSSVNTDVNCWLNSLVFS